MSPSPLTGHVIRHSAAADGVTATALPSAVTAAASRDMGHDATPPAAGPRQYRLPVTAQSFSQLPACAPTPPDPTHRSSMIPIWPRCTGRPQLQDPNSAVTQAASPPSLPLLLSRRVLPPPSPIHQPTSSPAPGQAPLTPALPRLDSTQSPLDTSFSPYVSTVHVPGPPSALEGR